MLPRGLDDKLGVVLRTCCLIGDSTCKVVGVSAAALPLVPRRDDPGRGGVREAGGGRQARGDPDASHACEQLKGFPMRDEL